MAKRKSSKLASGTPIRVRDGATMPEFAELSIAGWTGQVVEAAGSGEKLKYIVEWDAATLTKIPDAYKQQCEAQNLCTEMACLGAADVEEAA